MWIFFFFLFFFSEKSISVLLHSHISASSLLHGKSSLSCYAFRHLLDSFSDSAPAVNTFRELLTLGLSDSYDASKREPEGFAVQPVPLSRIFMPFAGLTQNRSCCAIYWKAISPSLPSPPLPPHSCLSVLAFSLPASFPFLSFLPTCLHPLPPSVTVTSFLSPLYVLI